MRTLRELLQKRFIVILTTTTSLMATTGVNSLLGFAFWWLAARGFSAHAVGVAAAAISAMALLGLIALMGLGTTLVGQLPSARRRSSLMATALLASGLVGLGLGAGFALLAPSLSPDIAELVRHPLAAVLFATGVALTAAAGVFDQAVLGVLRADLQLARNTTFAAGKLILVGVAALWFATDDSGLAIYATWVAGILVSLVVIGGRVSSGKRLRSMVPLEWESLIRLRRHALGHHALNLSRFAPNLTMPILVVTLLSPSANAGFYVALLIAGLVYLVSATSTFSLYAVASQAPENLPHQMLFTIGLSLAASLVGTLALVVLGPHLLGLFGPIYVEAAAILILLALCAFPLIVKDHWIAIHRIRGRTAWAAVWLSAGAVFELTLGAVGARLGGLSGLGIGWLAAITVQAVLMAPLVYSSVRGTLDATAVAANR